MEVAEICTSSQIPERELEMELDDLMRLENRLRAPRWRERAEAAHSAAETLVKDGCLRQFGCSEEVLAPSLYDRLLRQLLVELTIKDSNWQVRVAAVNSATTILAAARAVLPGDTFAEHVWVVLASCLDVQPEVQETACNCILQRLLVSSSPENDGVVVKLCDRFVEAAIGADSLSLRKFAKLSAKAEVVGLDSLPNGEILLAGMIAAICLQLLPVTTASDGVRRRQNKSEPDRPPLLLVAVAMALVDANSRQSRIIAGGLSRLLRSLGKPFYRQSLVAMFNVRGPVYFSGPDLARSYQNAAIITEDTANEVKTVATVTLLEALSSAFEASHTNEGWADVMVRKKEAASKSSSTSGFSEGELVALQHIIQMLQVPDNLTRTLKGQDIESKAFEFTKSAMSLLRIAKSIMENRNWMPPQDQLLPGDMVDDFLLACAAFSGGDGEYGGTALWSAKELRELSISLLLRLADVVLFHPVHSGLKSSPSRNVKRLISEQISSLLPRIKQIIQDSSGTTGSNELLEVSPEGSLGSSIVAAHQMQWLLSQLEHPDLGPHCQLVMPCVLTALDHFSPEVKRQAMRTCIHLAQNMNPTELRWYRDVTLDAVARSLIGCGDLWPVALRTAVTTVTRIEGRNPRGSWCGRIFSEMLEELVRQQDDQNKRVLWLQEISPHMEAMGLVLVAHFRRLLPLLFYWLHSPDDLTRILTLNRLQTVITYTWPRIPAHAERIWKEVIHTYQESRNRKSRSDIQTAVVGVCKLLSSCAGPAFEAVWQQDEEDESIGELISVIKQMKKETMVQV